MLIPSEIKAIAQQLAVELGNVEDKILTLEDAGDMLGKTSSAVIKLCQRGRIPYHKHFGTYYFSSAELRAFLLQ